MCLWSTYTGGYVEEGKRVTKFALLVTVVLFFNLIGLAKKVLQKNMGKKIMFDWRFNSSGHLFVLFGRDSL